MGCSGGTGRSHHLCFLAWSWQRSKAYSFQVDLGKQANKGISSSIQVLGTPTREEIDCMNPSYIEFRFPQIKSYSWYKVLFKRLTPETNLVCSFFQYSPNLDLISRSS